MRAHVERLPPLFTPDYDEDIGQYVRSTVVQMLCWWLGQLLIIQNCIIVNVHQIDDRFKALIIPSKSNKK